MLFVFIDLISHVYRHMHSNQTLKEALLWLVVCPGLFALAWFVAAAFVTAGAWKSHIQLPGVAAFFVALIVSVVAFLRVRWVYWWAKLVVLLVLVGATYFTAHAVGMYCLFGLNYWR